MPARVAPLLTDKVLLLLLLLLLFLHRPAMQTGSSTQAWRALCCATATSCLLAPRIPAPSSRMTSSRRQQKERGKAGRLRLGEIPKRGILSWSSSAPGSGNGHALAPTPILRRALHAILVSAPCSLLPSSPSHLACKPGRVREGSVVAPSTATGWGLGRV